MVSVPTMSTVDDEDREPSRQALTDRHDLLMLDRVDDRAEADREQHADVDQEQDIAGEVQRPDDDHAERGNRDGLRGRRDAACQSTIGQGSPR